MITNCLNSKYFGVPQNRERCFIIGHLRGHSTAEVFPVEGTDGEDSLEQIGQLYGTSVEPNPMAGRVYNSQKLCPSLDTCQGGNRMPKIDVVANTKPSEVADRTRILSGGGISQCLRSTDYKDPVKVAVNLSEIRIRQAEG